MLITLTSLQGTEILLLDLVNTSPSPTLFMKAPDTQQQDRTLPLAHQSFSQTKQDTGFEKSFSLTQVHMLPQVQLAAHKENSKGDSRDTFPAWPQSPPPAKSSPALSPPLQLHLFLLQCQGTESWSEAIQPGYPNVFGHRTRGQETSMGWKQFLP